MRLHTTLEQEEAIRHAARLAGVRFARLEHHGSRSAPHGWDVVLSGHGVTGGQYGTFAGKTATWDEWGIFLAALYREDPLARLGPYECAEHFHWATDDRFKELTLDEQHLRHRWLYLEHDTTRTVHECPGCGACTLRLETGWTWAEYAIEYLMEA